MQTLNMETGIVYALVAGLFWGTSPVLVRRGLVNSDVSAATLFRQGTILVTLILFTFFEVNIFSGEISTLGLLVFIATGVVGAYLGRTLFVISVAQFGASRAQSLNNSSPLITVLLAWLLLGESLSLAVVGGVGLIISGVFFITRAESRNHGDAAYREFFSRQGDAERHRSGDLQGWDRGRFSRRRGFGVALGLIIDLF
jgi:drug/metabolite transporter (DMT)-like permease